jgi:ATP-binding protein involved in chromosome partitioning
VASAKGGVGKSTVAVNLAVAAAGAVCASVFSMRMCSVPSLPTMLGTVGIKPELTPAKKMKPVMAHGWRRCRSAIWSIPIRPWCGAGRW